MFGEQWNVFLAIAPGIGLVGYFFWAIYRYHRYMCVIEGERTQLRQQANRDGQRTNFLRQLEAAAEILVDEIVAMSDAGEKRRVLSLWDDLLLFEQNNNRGAYDRDEIKRVLERVARDHGYDCTFEEARGGLDFRISVEVDGDPTPVAPVHHAV